MDHLERRLDAVGRGHRIAGEVSGAKVCSFEAGSKSVRHSNLSDPAVAAAQALQAPEEPIVRSSPEVGVEKPLVSVPSKATMAGSPQDLQLAPEF